MAGSEPRPPARRWCAGGLVLALLAGLPGVPLDGQTIRRPEPRAFRFSITPYLGPGWGKPRAMSTDPSVCPVVACITHRLSAGPVAGVEAQVPLPGPLALGLTVAGGRPNRVYCGIGGCEERGRVTVIQGSTLLLWRFRIRAPMYVGFGPALAWVSPGPVFSQRSSTTEVGGVLLAAYDFHLSAAVGARLAWWNYFLSPSGAELTSTATVRSVVWEPRVTAGLTFSFGSPTTRKPPRTFTR